MNYRTSLSIFLCLFFCLWSCKPDIKTPFEDLMDEFGEEYPFIKEYKWNLRDSFGYINDDASIIVSRKASDTLFTLELDKTIYEKEGERKIYLIILSYYSSYKVDNWTHSVYFDEYGDTLYHLRVPEDDFGKIDFIFGEYEYRYQRNEMTAMQAEYYLVYRDSLRKVKGSNLQPLPEIDN